MQKAVINVKTDQQTKQEAQALAKSCGLTLSSLINIQLKQFINDRRLVIDAPWPTITPNQSTAKTLVKVCREAKAGQVSQAFDNAPDFMADLQS